MDRTAKYYANFVKKLRLGYLFDDNDKRLEWLKDLTLQNLGRASEDFRSYVIALGTALISFVGLQLAAGAHVLPVEVNASALGLVLETFVFLSLRLEYAKTHLSARINGLCDIFLHSDRGDSALTEEG